MTTLALWLIVAALWKREVRHAARWCATKWKASRQRRAARKALWGRPLETVNVPSVWVDLPARDQWMTWTTTVPADGVLTVSPDGTVTASGKRQTRKPRPKPADIATKVKRRHGKPKA